MFANAIQHVARREQRPVVFIGAGLPEVEDTVLADGGITFFQRCRRVAIGPISDEDVRAALEQPVVDAGGWIKPAALDAAVAAASGYPFMVQLIGFHAWEHASDMCDIPLRPSNSRPVASPAGECRECTATEGTLIGMTRTVRTGTSVEGRADNNRRVGTKGQVVIPKVLRDRFGIEPGDEVSFWDSGGRLELRRVRNPETLKGRFQGLDLIGDLTAERQAERQHDQAR